MSRSQATTRRGTGSSSNVFGVVAVRDQRPQAVVVEEVVVAGEQVPGTGEPPAREHLVTPERLPGLHEALALLQGSACVAITEALHAPAEVPTRTSGTMSRSNSAFSIPTWQTAWLPPPASTNAVRIGRGVRAVAAG